MYEYFMDLSNIEKLFFLAACFGGFLFCVRLILQLIGGDSDADADVGDVDGGDIDVDADAPDSDVSFRLLSLHSITAFFMIFGLVGLALSREENAGASLALAGATVGGCVAMYIIARLFSTMKKLQSSGTLDLKNAIGQQGTVYLTIASGEAGQVQISIQNRLMTCEAIAEDGTEIKSGERIKVISVVRGNVMVVSKL